MAPTSPSHPSLPPWLTVQRLLLTGGALMAIAVFVLFDMYRLAQAELLWGYRPLWLLLAGWTGKMLFWEGWKVWRGRPFEGRALALSTATGVLLGVGFPDILPIPFVLWFAWVPLLVLEKSWRTEGKRKRALLPYVFHAMLLWNIIATYWVMNTSFAAGLFANITNSFLMLLPWVLYLFTAQHRARLAYPALIAYWLTFEYIHLNWDMTWPWLTLGNGWAEYPVLVQWYEYTGAFGGSLWIWIANLLLLRTWESYSTGKMPLMTWLKPALWLGVPMIVSGVLYATYSSTGETIDVVVVQPNYEPHYEKFALPESQQVKEIIRLSRPQIDENVDYLVFPETSYGFVEEADVWGTEESRRLYEAFMDFPNLKIVTGLNAYHDFRPGETHTPATRTRGQGANTIAFEVMNLAAQMPLNREIPAQTYRKSKLVPGAESFPFKKLLFFMEPVVNDLGGTTAGLGTQPRRTVFSSEAGLVAPVICYESIFGEYYAGYVRAGAQAAFIMTNDGWWDNTAGHRQHLYYARLRAIETRRSIARSANTGISCFIDQRGDITQPTRYNETIAIRGQVALNDAVTFYVQWGDLIARIALLLSAVFALNTLVSKLKQPTSRS